MMYTHYEVYKAGREEMELYSKYRTEEEAVRAAAYLKQTPGSVAVYRVDVTEIKI